jgi:UPF0176 protein
MSVLTLTEENPYVNISAYKFITFEDHAEQRQRYYDQCAALNLKGTILLTPEGINMFLAGFPPKSMRTWTGCIRTRCFADVVAKESFS